MSSPTPFIYMIRGYIFDANILPILKTFDNGARRAELFFSLDKVSNTTTLESATLVFEVEEGRGVSLTVTQSEGNTTVESTITKAYNEFKKNHRIEQLAASPYNRSTTAEYLLWKFLQYIYEAFPSDDVEIEPILKWKSKESNYRVRMPTSLVYKLSARVATKAAQRASGLSSSHMPLLAFDLE
jgi:hypothetical protein